MAKLPDVFPYGAGMREPQSKLQQRVTSGLHRRMYAAARSSRLTADWRVSNSSADSESVTSLTMLRARSRQLVRDAGFAKRARLIVVNNVIGPGVGMQAQVKKSNGKFDEKVNDEIETAFCDWAKADSCHTGGRLAFKHYERAAMAQVFETGECFTRLHFRAFGKSKIPFALELIEAERVADEIASSALSTESGRQIRMGVEVDEFYRPIAYYFRRQHPGEMRWIGMVSEQFERVPAEFIIHLAVIDRWPQTRGEPWLHAAARRLNDMEGYGEAEIVKARVQASTSGWITTPEDAESFAELQDDGSFEEETEAGVWKRLNPGEEVSNPPPSAPNSVYEAFMRAMLREVAAGIGVSYESLSKDYSQSNYSSSRLALLDDRDMWKFFQSWFITDFRDLVHKRWLNQAVLAGAIPSLYLGAYAVDPAKYEAVRYKPRGWTWVDPTKEVAAFKEAVKAGFTTVSNVIAATADGRDAEDVMDERARELESMREKGLVFDTSPEVYTAEAKAATEKPPPEPDETADEAEDEPENPAPSRVLAFGGKSK